MQSLRQMNEKVGRHPNQNLRKIEATTMPLCIDLIEQWDALITSPKSSDEIIREKQDSTTMKAGQWISDVPVNSKHIAMEFSCSRTTATDSLRQLLKDGIVKVKLIGRTKWYWKELA